MTNLSVSEAAKLLGVSTKTLHRWEAAGKIKSVRTAGGHRRYNVEDLLGHKNDASLTVKLDLRFVCPELSRIDHICLTVT